MNITITGRKVTLKDSFKQLVEKKLVKMDRIFDGDADAVVTVTLEKNRQTVEVTIRSNGLVLRAEDTAFDMEAALDTVVDALSRQVRKNKTKLSRRLHQGSFEQFAGERAVEEDEYKIVRNKIIPVKPLDTEEAILQMNMLGHAFFMFRSAETGEINVIYRRKDGDYGLLEPDTGN